MGKIQNLLSGHSGLHPGGRKPESRIKELVPGLCRDNVWTPTFVGVTDSGTLVNRSTVDVRSVSDK
jgi:hypothetical protein